VVHTHAHIDHVGGSQTIDALSDLPHFVPAASPTSTAGIRRNVACWTWK
jgi:glyoxylase-like metal-dependent hydrolase (beta-lactamase superfamily II)